MDLEGYAPLPESPPEGGGGGAEKASERASESRERMREAFKKASARAKAIKKDEQKTKKRDTHLAGVISAFVKGQGGDQQIINTIISLLKQEVSPEFLLGIISLYYPNVKQVIYEQEQEELMDNPRLVMETRQLTMSIQPELAAQEARDFDENNLPQDVKDDINTWVQDMMYTAFLHPTWLLPKVFHNDQVNSTVIQLTAFVLQRYLVAKKITGEFEKMRQFSSFIVTGVIKKTHEHVFQSKKLSQG